MIKLASLTQIHKTSNYNIYKNIKLASLVPKCTKQVIIISIKNIQTSFPYPNSQNK